MTTPSQDSPENGRSSTIDASQSAKALLPFSSPTILSALTPVPPTPANPPMILNPLPPSADSPGPALVSLTNAYLSAHQTALRMGLGSPGRLEATTKDGKEVVVQVGIVEEDEQGDEDVGLVGTVVGGRDDEAQARLIGWGVESLGKKVVAGRRNH